jgi:hypothetical protein
MIPAEIDFRPENAAKLRGYAAQDGRHARNLLAGNVVICAVD